MPKFPDIPARKAFNKRRREKAAGAYRNTGKKKWNDPLFNSSFPAVPIRYEFTGDKQAGQKFRGLGAKRYRDLAVAMAPNELEVGFNTLRFSDGTVIKTSCNYGLSKVEIYVPFVKSEKIEKQPENIDIALRFFVRIGSTEDVVYDELLDEVIEDNTRYYWIDFKSEIDDSDIKFYRQGEKLLNARGEETTKVAPNVSRNILLHIADPPAYMEDVTVKAFDLSYNNGEDQIQRFVMGYQYLAQNYDILYNMLPSSLPMPAGCVYDLITLKTKCPPNRLLYDTSSQTIAWYHVTQEWMDVSPGVPAEFTESTGAIAGLVGSLDYDFEYAGDPEKKWFFRHFSSISISGESCKDFSFNDGPWADIVREPVCTVADIVSINRTEAIIHCPYQHQLFEFTVDLDTREVDNCEEIEESSTHVLGMTGFKLTQGSSWASEGETGSEDYHENEQWPNTKTCDYETGDECVENYQPILTYYKTTDRRVYDPWDISYTGLYLPVDENEPYAFMESDHGENSGSEEEFVTNTAGYCQWSSSCQVTYSGCACTKLIEGYIVGRYGTTLHAKVTAQNITRTEALAKTVYDIGLQRLVRLSPDSNDNLLSHVDLLDDSVESFCEVCNYATPCLGAFDFKNDINETFTTAWPIGWECRDPIDMIDTRDCYPFDFPAMVYDDSGSIVQWSGDLVDYSKTENETLNKVHVYGLIEEFERNDISNVSFLDDRGTEGSCGVCVFLKDINVNSSRVFHGEQSLAEKTQTFMTALQDQNIIDDDEFIYTIGLL